MSRSTTTGAQSSERARTAHMLAVIARDSELTAPQIAERFGLSQRQAARLLCRARAKAVRA